MPSRLPRRPAIHAGVLIVLFAWTGPIHAEEPCGDDTAPPGWIEAQLADAERQSHAALEAHLAELDAAFAAARSRTARFAARVLGLRGFGQLALDGLAPTAEGRYAAFVHEAFAETVLAPETLDTLVRQVVADYRHTLRHRQ